jgi:hypothetical protein
MSSELRSVHSEFQYSPGVWDPLDGDSAGLEIKTSVSFASEIFDELREMEVT